MQAFARRGINVRLFSGGILAGIMLCFVCSLSAKPVGKFSYKKAPENFALPPFSGTVTVSDTMVAMAEYIHVMNQFYTDSIRDTPSIFFIIDHSTSMSYQGDMNDQNGNRFVVTSAFIDTIYKRFPSADVGIAVFKNFLHYRAGDSPFFAPLPMSYDPGGAYLPLYKLNGTYSGQTGIALLKSFLTTKTESAMGETYAELTYTPSTWPAEGTNINIGFEAAKKALLASQHVKECHYIVFLSDGDENDHYSDDPTYFEKGVNVPTTFTIFFTQGTTVPGTIRRMTTNIRANGYSLSNPRSEYWPFYNTDFNALMNFLMTKVYSAIGAFKPAVPKSLTVSSSTATVWSSADSTFNFSGLFPLIGQTTPFKFTIVYSKANGDTTHTLDFNVQTQAGYNLSHTDFDIKTWNRDIVFRHNGAVITTATEAMNQIELSFPWNSGNANYKYTNVTIELYGSVPPIDHETLALAAGTGVFTGSFTRATSNTPTPGNNIFEHAQTGDAIVAVFRNNENPKLPLDTLRVTIPLKITPSVELDSAVTRDLDGNGYLDHIDLFLKKDVVIANNAGASFSVQCYGIGFLVDSVRRHPANANLYSLCLHQHAEPSPLETSWEPRIGITSLPGVMDIANFPSLDGAPPVIGTVVKDITNPLDYKEDIVTVTMSEKVFANKGKVKLALGNQPALTFYAWIKSNGIFTRIDDMFNDITTFTSVSFDSVLVFKMTNGRNLTNNNWVNIRAPSVPLCDGRDNFPTDSNRKVRVRVNSPPVDIVVFPNPSGPSGKLKPGYSSLGDFKFSYEAKAIEWVYTENAGAVISLKNIPIPPKDKGFLKGYLKIYDVIGNSVTWAQNDTIFSNTTEFDGSTMPEFNMYWNGYNKAGTAVAPGIYRVIVYLKYPAGFEQKDLRLYTKIGFRPGFSLK